MLHAGVVQRGVVQLGGPYVAAAYALTALGNNISTYMIYQQHINKMLHAGVVQGGVVQLGSCCICADCAAWEQHTLTRVHWEPLGVT